MTKALLLDTETTGLIEPIIPWEIAWLELSEDFSIKSTFHQRYNPGKQIEYGAIATSFVWNEDLIHEPLISKFEFPKDVAYIIGHNIDYDWKVLGSPDVKRICTKALAQYLFPGLDSYSQSALICYIFGKQARILLKNAHSAFDDVMNCHRLLEFLCKKINRNIVLDKPKIEYLWELSELARIPTTCPIGEHKGKPWNEVPKGFLNWMNKQDFIDTYTKKAIQPFL